MIFGVLTFPFLGLFFDVSEAREDDLAEQLDAIYERIDGAGGFEEIEQALGPFRDAVTERVNAHQGDRSEMRVGEMIFNSEICRAAVQPEWTNAHVESGRGAEPMEAIVEFHEALQELGIDLLVVPVPSKIEAYPEHFGVDLPEEVPVSMGRTRFLLDLLEADVEVVDVLPAVLAAKDEAEVPLFETAYHHHSGLGARVVGEVVAERLRRYQFEGADPDRYRDSRRTGTERHHPEVPMKVWPVVDAEGTEYAHVEDSPVVVIGDSNAFAHGAGSWSSHIARSLGLAISEVARPGSGPVAHTLLLQQGEEQLQLRKAVVWIVTSSHIQRHPWRRMTK